MKRGLGVGVVEGVVGILGMCLCLCWFGVAEAQLDLFDVAGNISFADSGEGSKLAQDFSSKVCCVLLSSP